MTNLIENQAADIRAAQIRNELSKGIEVELAQLRHFDLRKRVREFAIFTGVLVCGVAVNYAAGQVSSSSARHALILAGVVITALAINSFVLLMHEGMHHTLFAGRFWNRWVSVLLGATFLLSFSAYQVMHTRHHDYLGDPRDPDDYRHYTRSGPLVWALHFVRLSLGPLLYIFLIPILAYRYGTSSERRRIVVEYLLLGAADTVIFSLWPFLTLLKFWLCPLIVVGQLTAIRGFTQHGITDASDPFIASRSIQAHPLVAFFLVNENYHFEHHLYPEIPSYRLRRLHELIWPRLPYAVTGRSYLGFIFKFFRATLKMDEAPIGLVKLKEE